MFLLTIDEAVYYVPVLAEATRLILLDAERKWDDDLITVDDYHSVRDAFLGLGNLARDDRELPIVHTIENGYYRIEKGAL